MKEVINRKWEMITQMNKEFDDIYHKIATHFNLSDSCFWVLYELYTAGKPCTQKQICDCWYYNKQTINSAIKSLEKIGYINKGYEENNKTNKKIGLTELGLKVAEETVKKVIEIEDIAFESIKEEELDTVIELLQRPLISFREQANKIIK